MDTTQYWAAQPTAELATSLSDKIDAYYQFVRASGRLDLWNRIYRLKHSGALDLGRIKVGGSQGELNLLRINHFANVLSHTTNLVTSQRPAFDAKASDASYEAFAQTLLSQQLLDSEVMREKRLEDVSAKVVDMAVTYGEGIATKTWNAQGGQPWGIDPASGAPINSGELTFTSFNPLDVVRDPAQEDAKKLRWVAVRTWVNRYDLMAKYPESIESIQSAPDRMAAYTNRPILGTDPQSGQSTLTLTSMMPSDEVEVFEFYHDRSPALPDGRRCLLVGKAILDDGPMPYKRLPVYWLKAGNQPGTNFGYSVSFDLAPIQQGINSLAATIATNQAAFGIQSILYPKGSGLNVRSLSSGLQAIQYDPALGKPEPLQLTRTSPETFQFLQQLVGSLEQLSAINAVVRGDPQASLKSGSALALVASQALQFSQQLQRAYVIFLEDMATGAIQDFQDFAELPQIALIAGKSGRSLLKEFTGKDLNKITRVVVDIGNPLSRTLAGRAEMAQQLAQAGLLKDPASYIEVLTSGRIEPAIDDVNREKMNIRSENERLAEGKFVQAIAIDMHNEHIVAHRTVLADPAVRDVGPNGETHPAVQATLEHLQQHIDLLQTTDPMLLQAIGIQPPMPPQMPQGPGSPVPPQAPDAAGMDPSMGPQRFGADMPQMPQPPVDPSTGQPAEAPPMPPEAIPANVRPN